jgi:hypothetical protein
MSTIILRRVRGVLVTIMTGSSSNDWILLALRLQPLLITLNHNTIAIPHTTQSLHTNPLSLFPLVSTITLSLWINRPYLHHSLTAPNCSTLKVFTSHVKSSQADFFGCELPAAISYRQLPTLNRTATSYGLSLYRLRTDPTEYTTCIVGEACFPNRFLAKEVYCCGADHLENTFTVLLCSACARTRPSVCRPTMSWANPLNTAAYGTVAKRLLCKKTLLRSARSVRVRGGITQQ